MFVAQGLDRAHNRRKDPDWIARRMRDPGSFFVPVRDRNCSFPKARPPGPVLLKWEQLEGHAEEDSTFFLGEENGPLLFCC